MPSASGFGAARISPQPTENTAAKEAETRDQEQTKGEITDSKAERTDKIREQGQKFETVEKERQNSQTRDRGGRS